MVKGILIKIVEICTLVNIVRRMGILWKIVGIKTRILIFFIVLFVKNIDMKLKPVRVNPKQMLILVRKSGKKKWWGKTKTRSLFISCVGNKKENCWYINTGCSNHMSDDKTVFVFLDDCKKSQVRKGDDTKLRSQGKGAVLVDSWKIVHDIMYVQGLTQNLKSLGQFTKPGYFVIFGEERRMV